MTGKLELEIIDIFTRDITGAFSINEISKKLNKSYPNINHKVNSLIEEKILSKQIIGRSYLCSVNLENDKAILLMSLNGLEKRQDFLKNEKDGQDLLQSVREIVKIFKIYTIFFHEKKLYFVLDHLFDSEAIKKKYPLIRKYKSIFLDIKIFQDLEFFSPIILFSPQEFYGLLARRKK